MPCATFRLHELVTHAREFRARQLVQIHVGALQKRSYAQITIQ